MQFQKDIYEKYMINKYNINNSNNCLTIYEDNELQSMEFINKFKVTQLSIEKCIKLIPKLNSLSIKQLSLELCNVTSIEELQLKNLEVLILAENPQNMIKFNIKNICKFQQLKRLDISGYNNINASCIQIEGLTTLKICNCGIQSIKMLKTFKNLTELALNNNKNIDIAPLSDLLYLTKLDLGRCNIKNTFTIQKLVHLNELSLYGNQSIEITPLQFLKKITVLSLDSCSLQNIDILQNLVNLQVLYIADNQITYIQPLQKIPLIYLYTDNNMIIDLQTIEKHTNFEFYVIDCQQKPTQRQISIANKLRNVHLPITVLKQMSQKYRKLKYNVCKYLDQIDCCLQQLFEEQEYFVEHVSAFMNQNIVGQQ
ncbi:leucine-rich_repeat domain-containing protein [Hexamita inflata]|uniref:Leucine-rich repeat domain-containing protein n=1 Tax=Hexamita inflata TaxID=28002 RepID=A0AA86R7P9_9EUKA|nr:leucine-rich repeat domain-containing protein [Hexamita inflata]